MTLPELVVIAAIGVVLAFVLVKLWRPLVKLALLAAVVLAVLSALDLPPFGDGPGGRSIPPAMGTGEPVTFTDTGQGLVVVNQSRQPLVVRVSFIVPLGPGRVGACNPFGTPRHIVPAGPARAASDQDLPPLQRLAVPARDCPNYTGFSLWAYDLRGGLAFEHHSR
jgi:hypothetical protein